MPIPTLSTPALLSGSVLKRSLLILNHFVDIDIGRSQITEDQIKELLASFKSDKEIDAYNQHRRTFEKLRYFLNIIHIFWYAYCEAIQMLDKILFMKQSSADAELLITTIGDIIKDKKERDEVITKVGSLSFNSFLNPAPAPICKKAHSNALNDYDRLISLSKQRFTEDQIKLKTAVQVMKDFIKDNKFKINYIIASIEDIEKSAKNPKPILMVWNKNNNDETNNLSAILSGKYLIDHFDNVSVDSGQYAIFKRKFL